MAALERHRKKSVYRVHNKVQNYFLEYCTWNIPCITVLIAVETLKFEIKKAAVGAGEGWAEL